MSNIVYLHGEPRPVAQFVRIGASGHRHMEQLLEAGRLPERRFIVDAGAFARQKDLIDALRNDGRELTLDTNVAELSVIGRYQGVAKGAPWAKPDGVLTEQDFRADADNFRGVNDLNLVGKIARFVVENGITRVLAPTHLLAGYTDRWLGLNISACETLRRALDVAGGKDVEIAYPLMITNATLNDATERKALIRALATAPINCVWMRISGFGANATAPGLRKYISAVRDFHSLEKPVVADGVGGLAALAIVAFGAASGVSHGVAEKERFDTSTWHQPPKPRDQDERRGGNNYVVLMPGIDRLIKPAQAEALISAPGGRRILSCDNRDCCPHGFEDMIKDPKGHYLRERARQYSSLSAVPEPLRAQHFLDNDLAKADRTARRLVNLKLEDEKLVGLLSDNAKRLDRMRQVLDNLCETENKSARSQSFPPAVSYKLMKNDRD